jgi:hypothetical protein
MAKLIPVTGYVSNATPNNGVAFDLDELQAFVGGYIEFVFLDDGLILCINEEGKLKELPRNPQATAYAAPYLREGDYIAGPALLLTSEEAGD